jgi:hypothetical protein
MNPEAQTQTTPRKSRPEWHFGRRDGGRHYLSLVFALLLAIVVWPPEGARAETPTIIAQAAQSMQLVKVRFEGDYLQVDALVKQFGAEIVRHDPPFLFLRIDPAKLTQLRSVGYQADVVDPDEISQQVVRIEKPSDADIARIQEAGGRVIQREPTHVVAQLTQKQLKALSREGVAYRLIQEGDLVPRFVRIEAPDEGSVRLVVGTGIDIFEIRDKIVIGRAFDDQIETLRRQGLQVEITPPPGP